MTETMKDLQRYENYAKRIVIAKCREVAEIILFVIFYYVKQLFN
jgi:hypothetical protein